MAALTDRALAAYAAVALPLAAAALPVHVQVPKFYSGLGLDLALIGVLLLGVRLLDAISDPLLGALADRIPERHGGRKAMIAGAVPALAAGLWLLFNPPAATAMLAPWLAATLVLSYLGLSAASIGHFALGSAMSRDYFERTRITAARGVAALAGVLLAAAVPELLVRQYGAADGLGWFALGYAPLLVATAAITIFAGPSTVVSAAARAVTWRGLVQPLRNPRFRRLAAVFLINGIAAAVPATLLLFFAADVLQRPDLTPLFLILYFVTGAAGMPLWVRLAARAGKARAWLLAMLLAVAAFVWAWFLGAGDVLAFSAVCVLSGLAFGADLALPASLLADVIDDDEGQDGRPDGAYFGLWHLLEKLALALAAGIALPLLQWLGYVPGTAAASGTALSVVYALVPCAIKLAAALLLWLATPEPRRATLSWKGVQA
jgi:GPH family glycoside/pentoside/hexuronide:cation symporter